jgi:uncharacterized protein
MPHQPVIDALEFAAAGGSLQGACRVGVFERLRSTLASLDESIEYAVQGARDERGRPALRVVLGGKVRLVCQRCLGAMELPVAVDTLLVLAASQREIDAEPLEPHAHDRLLARKDLRVLELLEDEMILALPDAPRHERCGAPHARGAEARISPFAGLDALVRGRH